MWKLLSLSLCITSCLYAIEVAHGTFIWPTGTGTQQLISGLSFRPKLVILRWNLGGSGVVSGAAAGFGAATSPTSRFAIYLVGGDGHNGNHLSSHRANRIVEAWFRSGGTNTIGARADIVSFDSNGVMFNVTTTTYRPWVSWLAIGGNDVENVSTAFYQSSTSTGPQPLTGAGFSPTSVLIFSVGMASDPSNGAVIDSTDLYMGVGFAGQTGQGSMGYYQDYTPGNNRRSQSTSHVIYMTDETSIRWSASLQSFDSDGMTLNWDNANTTQMYFFVVYLRGPRTAVVNFLQRMSEGSEEYNVTNFQPKAGLFLSFCGASATGTQTGARLTSGVAVSSTSQSMHAAARAPGNHTSASSFFSDRLLECYSDPFGATMSARARSNFTSWDTDGFTLYWQDIGDSVQRQFLGMLFGDDDGAPPARRRAIVIQ